MTVVACFIVGYFYLWIVNVAEDRTGWPPRGTGLPPVLYPGLNIGLLAICALSMYYGGIVMEKGRGIAFAWTVVVCCVAAAVLLWLRWLQFEALPFALGDNAYASFVWLMSGFHFLHVLSALLGTAAIGWLAVKGYFTARRRIAVQVDTMYWYFVALAWVPMYVVLYWLPRWFR
jgi:heme/copper-type cytochrome/quinol oxidase subunit 3